MVRALPAGLAATIAAPGQTPELSITVQDLVTRLTLFAQAAWPTGHSAALLSSSGKILRAILPPTGSGPIKVQRITPTDPTSWTAPGTTLAAAVVADAGAALAQTGGTIRCFYLRASDNTVVYRDSADDGQTWAAETALLANPEPFCTGIAAASIDDVWIASYTFATAANIIYRSTFSGGWSAWANVGPPTPLWTQVRGLAVSPGTTDAFIAGVALRGYSSGISAASFTFDGAIYSGFHYVQRLDSPAAGLHCSWPDLFYDGTSYYAAVTLTDDGSVSTSAHTRVTIWKSTDGLTWIPYLAAGSTLAYGAHLITTAGTTYVFDAVTTYILPPVPAPIDLTDDVLSLTITEAYNQPSTLQLTLSNDQAQYTTAPWLDDNVMLTVSLGYQGQTVETHRFFLDDWSLLSTATEQQLSIAARDYLKLLDRASTALLAYTNQTVSFILADLAVQSRTTTAAPPGTPQFSQTIGCFMVNPGETWLSALNRLSNVFGFIYVANGGASVISIDPLITDVTTWTYGDEVLAASRGNEADAANVVRVTGASSDPSGIPVWAEATDPAAILQQGYERYRNVVDRVLTTSAQCAIRASQEIRAEQRTSAHAQLIVALNPAHELGDVIALTESGTGSSGTRLRIAAMRWIASPSTQQWEHHLTLEAP